MTTFEIVETSGDWLDPVAEFLRPFMAANQILPRTREELQVLLKHGFTARSNDELIGFAAVEVYSKKLAEIQCLSVLEACRGKGVGRQLVAKCVERARSLGVYELMAITASENIFRDCGFDFSLPHQKRAMFIQTTERNE